MMTKPPSRLHLRDRDNDELNFTALPGEAPGVVHVQMVQVLPDGRTTAGFYLTQSAMHDLLQWYRGLL